MALVTVAVAINPSVGTATARRDAVGLDAPPRLIRVLAVPPEAGLEFKRGESRVPWTDSAEQITAAFALIDASRGVGPVEARLAYVATVGTEVRACRQGARTAQESSCEWLERPWAARTA